MVTLTKIRNINFGKLPAVVLPLEDYQDLLEDLEMMRSKKYKEDIRKSREEVKKGKIYTFAQVKKKLRIP